MFDKSLRKFVKKGQSMKNNDKGGPQMIKILLRRMLKRSSRKK